MSATVNFARLNELQAKGANLDAAERAEYIRLMGEAQSALHAASQHASGIGIKVADTRDSTQWANAVDILVYNLEGILRYHGNVVCGNQVAALNTIALKLGVPQHSSPMEWYNALGSVQGSLRAATTQGIADGRKRINWPRQLGDYAAKHGKPEYAAIDVTELVGKVPAK